MCLLFGLSLLAMGIFFGYPDGVSPFLCGIMVLWFAWDMRPGQSYKIDSSVKNKIIAHDGNGRYLVKAKTSRQITGPRPHVTDNLPAHIYSHGKGEWIVDRNTWVLQPEDIEKINWLPVPENKSINPRGKTKTGGFLQDLMEGYDHNYIQEDE